MLFYYIYILVNIFDKRIFSSLKKCFSCVFKINKSNENSIEMMECDENVNNIDEKKVKFLPDCNNKENIKRQKPELNFDKSSSSSSLSNSSSSSSGEYEDPYDLIKPYKNFKRKNYFEKFKLFFVLPARLVAFVSINKTFFFHTWCFSYNFFS